jgi:endonuclease/exonuclease/phosphatase (EEP) superfamily protein YafD
MESLEITRFVIFAIGYTVIAFSLLPVIRSSYWFVRVFDYPRSQKFWINAVIFIVFVFFADPSATSHIIFLVALFLNQVYLLILVWNYTPLASIQMKMSAEANAHSIKIFIANVFQDNLNSHVCLAMIHKYDPDIILLVETNDRWKEEMQASLTRYPYQVLKPQSNTYGMILYSRLEITTHSIRFLVDSEVPSIVADIKAKDGKEFRLYCLHPKPPVPTETNDSTARDAEILIVGKEAKKTKKPVIVAGDLNDVAWSYTTRLFLKVSGLLDPRIGRGFFSTFHAKYPVFRWPLDHVFCSSHFYLHHLERLPSIGSDHFPIFIEVSLMPYEVEANLREKKELRQKDIELAEEKIEAAL